MPLTKQQLLIPRVLCIGTKEGEPNDTSRDYISGNIITVGDYLSNSDFLSMKATAEYLGRLVEKFPHLFKPLPWWYGRTVEEMPGYILASKTYGIVKVNEWRCMGELCLALTDDGMLSAANWEFEPADESDYELYVSKIFTDKIVELSKEKNRLEMTIGKGVTLEKGGFASDRIDEIEKEITQLKDQYKK